MNIPENLQEPRSLGLMALVNQAAQSKQKDSFAVSIWLSTGQCLKGIWIKIPSGGYTLQDIVLEAAPSEDGQPNLLWSCIIGISVH